MGVLPPHPDADDRYRERVGLGPLRPRRGVPTPAALRPLGLHPAAPDDGRIPDRSVPVGPDHDADPDGGVVAAALRERAALAETLDELRGRLRTLETTARQAERRTLPKGFAFAVPGAGAATHSYVPVEAEIAYGLIVWPRPGLWIRDVQVGRRMFVDHGGLDPKSDLRELLVSDHGPTVLYPSVGMTITVENRTGHPLLAEGAVYVTPMATECQFPAHPNQPVPQLPHRRIAQFVRTAEGGYDNRRMDGMLLTQVGLGVFRATFVEPSDDPTAPWPNDCESTVDLLAQHTNGGVAMFVDGGLIGGSAALDPSHGMTLRATDSAGASVNPDGFTVIVTTPRR